MRTRPSGSPHPLSLTGIERFDELAKDLGLKRNKNTGKGMPSIRGPSPDTVGIEFLGPLITAEFGISKLVFAGASFLTDVRG